MFNRLVNFLDKHNILDNNRVVFVVNAPLFRLLCLSLIKSKEPLKVNYILAGFYLLLILIYFIPMVIYSNLSKMLIENSVKLAYGFLPTNYLSVLLKHIL